MFYCHLFRYQIANMLGHLEKVHVVLVVVCTGGCASNDLVILIVSKSYEKKPNVSRYVVSVICSVSIETA